MVKYELKKDSIEVKHKDRKEIKPGVVLTAYDKEPELIRAFGNKEDALEELKKCKSSITKLSGYYLVEEYYVEENEYSDDDEEEWMTGGDVWEYSKMEIELVEKPSYNTLAVFDNMADAEKAMDNYEGENEVYLSF